MDSDNEYSPSLKVSTKNVFLNTEKDWTQWLFHIKDAADGNEVWEHINPALEAQPAELVRPVKPVVPTQLLDDEGRPIPFSDAEIKSYNLLRSAYNDDLKVYDKWRVSMERMRSLITATTSTQYHTYFDDLK